MERFFRSAGKFVSGFGRHEPHPTVVLHLNETYRLEVFQSLRNRRSADAVFLLNRLVRFVEPLPVSRERIYLRKECFFYHRKILAKPNLRGYPYAFEFTFHALNL